MDSRRDVPALRHVVWQRRPHFTLILTPASAQEDGGLLELSLALCTLVIHMCICIPYLGLSDFGHQENLNSRATSQK